MPILPQFSQKKREGQSAEIQILTRNTTVLNKQKTHHLRIQKLAEWSERDPLKLCCRLEKPIKDPTPSWSAVPFLRLVVFSASQQPHKTDSRLSLMRSWHAPAHQSFRSVDPQNDLIWRTMTKTRFDKQPAGKCDNIGGVWRVFFLSWLESMLTINYSLVRIEDATTNVNAC